jgi:hypothetical protein
MGNSDLSDEEWKTLFQRAQDVVDSDETSKAAHLELLFSYFDALISRYGERSSLLCIRADFTHNLEEKDRLLSRAYSLAESTNDNEEAFEAAHSIATMFVDKDNLEEAERWLKLSREHLGRLDDFEFRVTHDVLESYREDSEDLARTIADMRRDRERRLS